MIHSFGDIFNPPGLTNFIGCVQSDIDITGIRSLNFPPFACSDTVTANLFIDGKFFPSTGSRVTFVWYPDRIERQAEYKGIVLRATTALATGKTALVTRLEVENRRGSDSEIRLKFGFRGGVTKSMSPWNTPFPPTETDNEVLIDPERNALLYKARNSPAYMMQGISMKPLTLNRNGTELLLPLRSSETKHIDYVNAIAESENDAQSLYDECMGDVASQLQRTRNYWNEELRAVFTPGNGRYSGYLPTLVTDDPDILKLYHIGMLGVIYFKRDSPHSVYGRAYDTLMPRYWQTVTFLWDYSLSSVVHAMLDPAVMKKYLELWMGLDIHQHFGTDYLTGSGIGPWYSVNDFAMCNIARDYLRWTGDFAWLDSTIESRQGKSSDHVLAYLLKYSTNWHRFRTKSGLADYGGLANLLECVSTYIHEVASLNAANVFNMRFAAELLKQRGETEKSDRMLEEARELVKIIGQLYLPGQGSWGARFPDGTLVDVRQCYDLLTILNTIGADLSEEQVSEITSYFVRELQTPVWMHALSCNDDDAMFSVRPDHQWTGAYPAWPPQTALGLYRVGRTDLAFNWVKGLAKSANQGPFGQAHFAESVVPPEDGGARKAPPDMPYITDWTCSSNGSWVSLIIEGIFGINASLHNGISAQPRFGSFDPSAELHNVHYQGKQYIATRKGIIPAE